MQPTYLNQKYLALPQPRISRPYTVLPLPNPVDSWIRQNEDDAYTNILVPGYLLLSDTPNLCRATCFFPTHQVIKCSVLCRSAK